MTMVATGNPKIGFVYYGPFAEYDLALKWAQSNYDKLDADWWILPLADPDSPNDPRED